MVDKLSIWSNYSIAFAIMDSGQMVIWVNVSKLTIYWGWGTCMVSSRGTLFFKLYYKNTFFITCRNLILYLETPKILHPNPFYLFYFFVETYFFSIFILTDFFSFTFSKNLKLHPFIRKKTLPSPNPNKGWKDFPFWIFLGVQYFCDFTFYQTTCKNWNTFK